MPLTTERLSAITDEIKQCKDAEAFRLILSANERLSDYYDYDVICEIMRRDRFDLFKVLLEIHTAPTWGANQHISQLGHDVILDSLITVNLDKGKVVINKRVDFIKLLLEYPTSDGFKKRCKSHLYTLIQLKDDEMLKALLEHGKLALTVYQQKKLVFDAMSSDSFTTLKILFEKDFIVESVFSEEHGQDILKFIFKKAPKADGKYTEDSCNFIRALFDKLNKNKGPNYTHPFVDFCIHKGSPEVLKFLIESQIVKIDTIIPSTSWTSLSSPLENFTISMAAARNDNICLLNILKEEQHRSKKAPSIFDQVDSNGHTVVHHVKSSEAATIVLTKNNINHKDKEGNSPLFHFLAHDGILHHFAHMRTEEDLIDAFKLIETLIGNSDIGNSDLSNNKSGQNILHALLKLEISDREKQTFTDLVNKIFTKFETIGTNISQLLIQKDEDFKTPLLLVLDEENFSLFKLILKQQEKHKVTTLVDEYILEGAIISGFEEIVEHLLSQEVDLKSLIPEETLVDIANDLEENQELFDLSDKGKKCLKLLNKATEGFKKPIETDRNKNSGKIAFSELRSLLDNTESGSVKEVKSILSKAGPASRTILSLILRELQKSTQNSQPISDEKKQCIDLLADTVKKLEDSKNVNNSDKSQVNGKKSLAEYFRSFIKWVQEGLRKMYNFLTGNAGNKIKNNGNPNKDDKKPGAPGATPTVAKKVKENIKKQSF